MAVNDLITFRKGTASAWTSVNPVLASGEPGYDLTNSILKIGDGVSNWVSLSGIGSTSVGGSSSSFVGVRGIISTTGNLTSFAVSGGYPVGYLDLFQDGVKLVSSLDFSATDGSNVTLSNSVPSGTVLEYLTMASGVSSGGGSSSLPSNISGSLSVDGDSSYGSVVMLLNGNTASDSSSYKRTVTLNGAGVSVTGLPKYGSSSFAFTSATSYVSVPSSSDFSFGTGDFTMEAWIYATSYPQNNDGAYVSTIFGRQQAGDHCYRMDLVGTANSFTGLFFNGFPDNSGGQSLTANYSFQLNTWYHIAVSRISGMLYMFINGVLQNAGGTSFTVNIKESSNEARLGALNFGHPYYFQFFGYIADARITKGLGRYSSNFTPPTSELPSNAPYSLSSVSLSVSGSSGSGGSGLSWSSVPVSPAATGTAGQIAYDNASGFFYIATATDTWKRAALSSWDPYFSSVSILLPMNGTNNSTAFVDAGPSALAVTANGDAKISAAQSKFGGASAVFDGTGDFLSVPNSAAFDFGSGDLAIEAWIYIASNATADPDGNRGFAICSTWAPTGTISGWILGVLGDSTTTGTGLQLDSWNEGNATLYRATVSLAHSMWHHVAASVSGGTRRLYLNGTLVTGATTTVGSGYTQFESLGNGFRVGNTANTSYPVALNGYIDDLRITKGSARGYTGETIPVPLTAFPTS